MNILIVLIIIDTVAQFIVCHFNFWWVLALISRLMFSMRVIGATIKIQKLAVLEGVAWFAMLLFNMIFAKGHVPWIRILLFLAFSLAAVFIMFLDDILYVYIVEDDDD